MNKFIKRTGAFFAALCLIVSLLPSFVFAAEDSTVTVDFTTATITDLTTANCTPPAQVTGEGFAAVASETTGLSGVKQISRNFKSAGINLLYIQTAKQSWITQSTPKEAQWTIEVDMKTTEPGWYDISLLGGKWNAGAAYYIYADGQYAGFYDCYDSASGANPYVDRAGETHLNTLYLTPDTNGKVKVMFALAETITTSDRYARFLASKLTLTPTTEPDFSTASVDSKVEIPENVTVGTEIPFSASVKLSDGSTRYINGYKADRTVDVDNNIGISLISGSGIEVHDGYIKSTCAGPVKFAVAAKINGTELKSKEYEFTSTITEPEEMVLDFTQNIITAEKAKAEPSGWSFAKNAGYEFISDKSTTSGECQFNHAAIGGTSFVKIQTAGVQWPTGVNVGPTSMFTVKKYIGAAGYYKVQMQAANWYANSRYAIYVNGEYAGDWNSWSGKTTEDSIAKEDTATTLNTIYLPEGNVEISFRLRHMLYAGGANFIPWYLTLTPVTEDGATLDHVETSLDETLQFSDAATLTGTAQAIMKDETARHFGYTDSGALPSIDNAEDDVISVSSSNPAVVSVETVCVEAAVSNDTTQTIDPTTTKFTLTANNPGTAVITVTAQVNGEKKTATSTITVPYTDGSEAVDTSVSVAVQSENTEEGTVSWNGTTIGQVKMGDTVTATATAKEGYEFKFWKNSSGQVLSDKASESFVINTNSAITAVFDKVDDAGDTVSVELYNANGMPFDNKTVNKNTTFADAITGVGTPTYTGFGAFKHWSMYADESKISDDMPITETTRAVAIFNDPTEQYTVKVNGTAEYSNVLYGTEVTVSSDASDFSYWKLGEKIVSYDKSYKFTVWGDVDLTEVKEGSVTAAPIAVLDEVDGNPLLIYSVPTGHTIVEAGILFGSNADITISSVDGSRAAAARGTGQFTAQPNTDKARDVARGYLIYRADATGETRVIYSK